MPIEIIPVLQAVRALTWGFLLLLNAAAVLRVIRNRPRHGDPSRAVLCFIAATEVGFSTNWLIFPPPLKVMAPEGLVLWAGMYVLSSMCALAAAWVVIVGKRVRGE